MPSLTLPHLRKNDHSGRSELVVHGDPFFCLAGELQNSTSSCAAFFEEQLPNLRKMHLNTLLVSISWEQIEAVEGTFDFVELDKVIALAREYGFKLIIVWFGSYKNGMSTYVPPWVKQDPKRFPRCFIRSEDGGGERMIEVLSPFAEESWRADARAFGQLMEHISSVDRAENTCIMVQVENEPGLLGDGRDRSSIAEDAWQSGVPEDLRSALDQRIAKRTAHPLLHAKARDLSRTNASWIDTFGSLGEEAFMANALSRYVEQVAAAGKRAYPLPSFINTWLSCDDEKTLDLDGIPLKHNMKSAAGGGNVAGDYPSGGACPQVFDIWRVNAPSLDIISPDIYLHSFPWVCQQYTRNGQPLLVPEMRRDAQGARRILYAYGAFDCLAISPFGVDTLTADEAEYSRVFSLLWHIRHPLLQAKPDAETFGFYFDEYTTGRDEDEQHVKQFGEWVVTVRRAHVFGKPGPGSGVVIKMADDEFLCAGWGFSVFFAHVSKPFSGILSAYELDETLKVARWLNGDETKSGACLIMPNEVPDEGGFPIPITIPARTAIARCKPYAL